MPDRLWIGVEQEFELFDAAGRKLDFRDLFAQTAGDLEAARFRDAAQARLSPLGHVISSDGAEAEVATAPLDLARDPIEALGPDLLRARADLQARLSGRGVAEIRGYSTHIGVSAPPDRVEELAEAAMTTVLPALMLLMEGPESQGLLLRPRRGRLEVCGEYIDDPDQLVAAAAFVFGALRLLEGRAPPDAPRFAPDPVLPSDHRRGWRLPLDAYGEDIRLRGRGAALRRVEGGTLGAGALLGAWAARMDEALEGVASAQTRARLRAAGEEDGAGGTPLMIERAPETVGRVAPRETPRFASQPAHELAALSWELPGLGLELAFFDWEGLVLRRAEAPRFLALPAEGLGGFLAEARRDGARAFLAGLARGAGPLSRLDQLARPALYEALDPAGLARSAEDGGGKKPGPGAPPGFGGTPGIVVDGRPCKVEVTLKAAKLCLGETGEATCRTDPDRPDRIVWILPPGLDLLRGQGTKRIAFRARRAGLFPVECVIETGPRRCRDKKPVSVPEMGLVLGDDAPVLCVGVAGHAPGIRLSAPVPAGAFRQTVPTAGRGASAETMRARVVVAGRLVDPLGYRGATLEVGDALGLIAPAGPVAVDPATGAFRFAATLVGLGAKRLTLRARGVTGAVSRLALSGRLRAARPPGGSALAAIPAGVAAAYRADRARTGELIFGDGNGPLPSAPLHAAALAAARAPFRRALEEVDRRAAQAHARRLRRLEVVWSAGETAMGDVLSERSRYRLIAIDAAPPAAPSAELLDDVFEMRAGPGALVSVDPAAFVPVPGGHDDAPVPGRPDTVMQDLPRALENDFLTMSYRDCRQPVGAPYRVEVGGQPFALVNIPNAQRFDVPPPGRSPAGAGAGAGPGGGPGPAVAVGPGGLLETRIRKKPARLEAALHGKCDRLERFEWRVTAGPDLASAEIETEGVHHEICRFSAPYPGLYQVEARAVTDHDDPLAADVFEVEVLDLQLSFSADGLEDLDEGFFRVSADQGEHLEVHARVAFTSDLGLAPLTLKRARWRLRWAGTEQARAGDGAVREVNAEAVRPYRLGRRAGATIAVNGFLAEAKLTGADGREHAYDLSALSFEDSLGTILVAPGRPETVTLRILPPGTEARDAPEHRLEPLEMASEFRYDNVEDIRRSALGLERFMIGDERLMRFVVSARDRWGNPMQEETPVGFRSFGKGEIRAEDGGDGALLEHRFDAEGRVEMLFVAPPRTRDESLVMLTVDENVYLIGNAVAALTVVPRPDPTNLTTEIRGEAIRVGELSGGAYAEFDFRTVEGRAANARFRVQARLSAGSLRDREDALWTPDLETLTDPDGRLRLYFNPMPHTPDGGVPFGARRAFGDVSLFLSVGTARAAFTVHFEVTATVRRAPILELPAMPLVRQADLGWLDRPRDPGAASGPALLAPGELLGERGREILVEVKQDVRFETFARFDFDTPVTGLWNPPFADVAPPRPSYRPPRPLELRGRGHGRVEAALAGHAAIAPPPVPPPRGGNALKLEYSAAAALAGLDYAATVPGCAGFELAFAALFPQDQGEWELLRLEGTDPAHAPLPDRGALSVAFSSLHIPPSLVLRYDPKGCAGRLRARAIPIAMRIPLGAWVEVAVSVLPDIAGDCIEIEARFQAPGLSRRVSRRAENFNFLAGRLHRLKLGLPADGAAYLDRIDYRAAQNASLHLRRDDGLDDLWHMEALEGGDRVRPPLVAALREGAAPPAFARPLAPHAEIAVAYCDRVEFERIRVAAADRDLARAAAYGEDVLLGFIVGDAQTVPGMGSDLVAGLVGWGDARDIAKNIAFLWPGGRDPNWSEFGLAVCGLALDLSQPLTAGATTPANAFIACLKVMLKRLEPLIRAFPEARRIAADLCDLAMRTLRRLREMKILQIANAGFTLNELRQVAPPGLVDYLFAGLDEDHLRSFAEFGRRLTPAFNPFMPVGPAQIAAAYDAVANIERTAARAQEMREAAALLMGRIDLLVWFFNPNVKNLSELDWAAKGVRDVLAILGDLDPSAGLEATERFKRLLQDAESWHAERLASVGGAVASDPKFAKKAVAAAIKLIGREGAAHGDLFGDPVVIRGLTAFMAASGPVAAGRLVRGFRLSEATSRARFRDLMVMCDDAAELVSDLGRREGWSGAEVRRTLNRLWHGLSLRGGVGLTTPLGRRIATNARNGAEAELMAVAAFARAGLVHATGHTATLAFNPLRSGGTQLMDFLGAFVEGGVSAIEVKSIAGSLDSMKKHGVSRILDQYERWVTEGFARNNDVRQFQYAVWFKGPDAAAKLEYLEAAFEERFTTLLSRFQNPADPLIHQPPPVEIIPLGAMELIS